MHYSKLLLLALAGLVTAAPLSDYGVIEAKSDATDYKRADYEKAKGVDYKRTEGADYKRLEAGASDGVDYRRAEVADY
ncbi:MAG: hypothetical protein FRX48_05001 [Lasallia pustulata]|uniref:Uncharacterized protein n=1 Tax=Lasallia pustulata TaxID=136370 RepID=A0A5M8PQC4_9LECA|nr:MAG: hypothetical protein FRX48_05001 [Lasallia pustulata]